MAVDPEKPKGGPGLDAEKGLGGAKTEQTPAAAAARAAGEGLAYASALLINFVDQMGSQFTNPVLVPYGQAMLHANLGTIGFFTTARGVGAIISNIWMPIVSDKLGGRKWIAFLSIVGCACGYLIQGLAYNAYSEGHPHNGSFVFGSGRFVAGFFSGMQPVLQAYITDLSAGNVDLLTQRLVFFQVASQIAGIALSPLAGVVGSMELYLPFYVCFGTGCCAMLFVVLFFKEAKDIHAGWNSQPAPPVQGAAGQPQGQQQQQQQPLLDQNQSPPKNPAADAVILNLFVAYFMVFFMVQGGSFFTLPQQFKQESYIPPICDNCAGTDQQSKDIAKWLGLANLPLGLAQIIVALGLYRPMTKKFGDKAVVSVAGVACIALYPLVGFWAHKMWQVFFVYALIGVCFGFMVPAAGPLAARYASAAFPKQIATAQGIPIVGMQIAVAFTQNLMTPVLGTGETSTWFRLELAWCVMAVACAIFICTFLVAFITAEKRIEAIKASAGGLPTAPAHGGSLVDTGTHSGSILIPGND